MRHISLSLFSAVPERVETRKRKCQVRAHVSAKLHRLAV